MKLYEIQIVLSPINKVPGDTARAMYLRVGSAAFMLLNTICKAPNIYCLAFFRKGFAAPGLRKVPLNRNWEMRVRGSIEKPMEKTFFFASEF